MKDTDQGERDIDAIGPGPWGRVVASRDVVPYIVIDPTGAPVQPVLLFLRDFVDGGNAAESVRSYAFALQRWWRFLRAIEVEWDRATSVENRDFVLWLMRTTKPRRSPRTKTAQLAGGINPVTLRQHLDDRYQPRTIRHSNAVLRSFYDYWIECGEGPVVKPHPTQKRQGPPPERAPQPLGAVSAGRKASLQPACAQTATTGHVRRALDRVLRRAPLEPRPSDHGSGNQHGRAGQRVARRPRRRHRLGRSADSSPSQRKWSPAVATCEP
ncbi:hypothetical protein [Nonomuraea angiospora]|uniref:hypothetical protein n=1 Tax=Nonomuraea angiospora TaxID=46172 RepID=UPI0021F2DB24|nr:hypothetical protein [Nonomuraea angiospora]